MPEQRFDTQDIDRVVGFLKQGGVLAYPSESVWGIGCDAFCQKAFNKILSLKSRPFAKGVIVLTDDIQKIASILPDDKRHVILQKILQQSTDVHIKQATTWLLPIVDCGKFTHLMGGFDKLAVRVTMHPVLKRICRALTDVDNPYGFLVSTSCNITNQAPAEDFKTAFGYFGEDVGYLMAQNLGFNKPSQIIDVTTDERLR